MSQAKRFAGLGFVDISLGVSGSNGLGAGAGAGAALGGESESEEYSYRFAGLRTTRILSDSSELEESTMTRVRLFRCTCFTGGLVDSLAISFLTIIGGSIGFLTIAFGFAFATFFEPLGRPVLLFGDFLFLLRVVYFLNFLRFLYFWYFLDFL